MTGTSSAFFVVDAHDQCAGRAHSCSSIAAQPSHISRTPTVLLTSVPGDNSRKICSALIRAASDLKPESLKTARSRWRLAILGDHVGHVVREARDQCIVGERRVTPPPRPGGSGRDPSRGVPGRAGPRRSGRASRCRSTVQVSSPCPSASAPTPTSAMLLVSMRQCAEADIERSRTGFSMRSGSHSATRSRARSQSCLILLHS